MQIWKIVYNVICLRKLTKFLNHPHKMKKLLQLLFTLFFTLTFFAQDEKETEIDFEKIEKSMVYQTGVIKLEGGNASINVPKGFKFIDAKQAQYVLHDLWGNPEDTSIQGAIVPENTGVTYSDCWLFTISFDAMGFVKDDDAKDVNYEELLTEMKTDISTQSVEREKAGYGTMQLIGWASKPFYDEKLKVLHWAKELKFNRDSINTLNYDLRVLGRKGVYVLSAVGSIKQLPEIKKSISNVLTSIQFNEGEKYANFDSSTDTVAAWTIGGLVAGKVLAKVGFFAIIAKFGKFIVIGLIAAFAAVKKFFFGNKNQEVTRPKTEDIAEVSIVKTEE